MVFYQSRKSATWGFCIINSSSRFLHCWSDLWQSVFSNKTRIVGCKIGKYKVIKELGEGTSGSVRQAINRESGEIVAIKQIKRKYDSWEKCLNSREVKCLKKLNHPNIMKLKEITKTTSCI